MWDEDVGGWMDRSMGDGWVIGWMGVIFKVKERLEIAPVSTSDWGRFGELGMYLRVDNWT